MEDDPYGQTWADEQLEGLFREGAPGFEEGESQAVIVRSLKKKGLNGQIVTFAGLGLGDKTIDVFLKLQGFFNASNAAAAAATALAMGIGWGQVKEGLERLVQIPGRHEIREVGDKKLILIDDSYNSNPTAVASALGTLCLLGKKGKRAAILGDMLELGPKSPKFHYQVGLFAARMGLDWLALVGKRSLEMARGAIAGGMAEDRVSHFIDPSSAAFWVYFNVSKGTAVLVKGSRAIGLESEVNNLLLLGEKK
jgi:UDP-N-acetylmuramyl pentapeptide synthase